MSTVLPILGYLSVAALVVVMVVDFRRRGRGMRPLVAAIVLAVVHVLCWLPEESSRLRTANLVLGVLFVVAAVVWLGQRASARRKI